MQADLNFSRLLRSHDWKKLKYPGHYLLLLMAKDQNHVVTKLRNPSNFQIKRSPSMSEQLEPLPVYSLDSKLDREILTSISLFRSPTPEHQLQNAPPSWCHLSRL